MNRQIDTRPMVQANGMHTNYPVVVCIFRLMCVRACVRACVCVTSTDVSFYVLLCVPLSDTHSFELLLCGQTGGDLDIIPPIQVRRPAGSLALL